MTLNQKISLDRVQNDTLITIMERTEDVLEKMARFQEVLENTPEIMKQKANAEKEKIRILEECFLPE